MDAQVYRLDGVHKIRMHMGGCTPVAKDMMHVYGVGCGLWPAVYSTWKHASIDMHDGTLCRAQT